MGVVTDAIDPHLTLTRRVGAAAKFQETGLSCIAQHFQKASDCKADFVTVRLRCLNVRSQRFVVAVKSSNGEHRMFASLPKKPTQSATTSARLIG